MSKKCKHPNLYTQGWTVKQIKPCLYCRIEQLEQENTDLKTLLFGWSVQSSHQKADEMLMEAIQKYKLTLTDMLEKEDE